MVMEAKKRIMFHGLALGIDLGFAGNLQENCSEDAREGVIRFRQ